MSAKELTIFAPESALSEGLLSVLAKDLLLVVDAVPLSLGLSFDFSAQKGSARSYFAIEYKRDDSALIREVMEWERPSDSYKNMLDACKSSVSLYYRELDVAKDALLKLGATLKAGLSSSCLVDNGRGCLLKFNDVLVFINQRPQWSWEKEQFPELPDVAASEWE